MGVKSIIGLPQQFAVKPLLATTRFVPSDEQDRSPLGIERKGHTPDAVGRIEPKLLHVRVPRVLQRIYTRTAKVGSELLKKAAQSQNFVLHVFGQSQ
jgi:hypothetical protein